MDRRRFKFVLLVSGVVVTMAFLVWVGLKGEGGFAYFVTVSEEFKHAPHLQGRARQRQQEWPGAPSSACPRARTWSSS